MMVKEAMSCKDCHSLDTDHDCFADVSLFFSTKLDAEKRLALQEEKQALEARLLEV